MNYRNERMARGFRSLDALLEGFDASKLPALSDGGDGARQIRRAAWGDAACATRPPYRERCVAEARMRLAEAGLARLLPVLDQVVLNGKNRRESICRLAMKWRIPTQSARRKYYRGVTELTKLFSPNKIKGETLPVKC
jgi:hypothetical protein